ncbi:MAG: diguanylate cyclase [Lysobacter sp.]|nr:diguanylate cyclase [Lysobacter sp.]
MPSTTFASDLTQSRLRFIRRIRRMRSIGLGIGMLCVGSALYAAQAPPAVWALLAFNGLIWPHLAYALARRHAHPERIEFRSLTVDSAMGGVWIALMQFNLLPSVLLAVMLTMDKLSVGGPRFASRALLWMMAACAATAALNGFAFAPHSGQLEILGSLPLLIAYPLTIGIATWELGHKVRVQNKLLREVAVVDFASGLANRRHWLEVVRGELARHQRTQRPATLMMIDIDHFKQINDSQGHTVGDQVIEEFAALLQRCLRETDTAGRYGGDEFAVVLPGSDLHDAQHVAQRALEQVRERLFAQGLRCSISIGAASAGPSTPDAGAWIRKADTALYRAKAAGRDRVELAE